MDRIKSSNRSYVPALGFHWLTRMYDPVIALSMRERALKERLIQQAGIDSKHVVLDVGCGTGTLAIQLKRTHPDATVVGLDGDPSVLQIARRKIVVAGLDIELREGLAGDESCFPPGSFDRVLTSLLFHHLTELQKEIALKTIRTWLRPGGELHVLDFGPQDSFMLRTLARGVGWLDGVAGLQSNWDGRLPQMMRDAGFNRANETGRSLTVFGSVSFFAAS